MTKPGYTSADNNAVVRRSKTAVDSTWPCRPRLSCSLSVHQQRLAAMPDSLTRILRLLSRFLENVTRTSGPQLMSRATWKSVAIQNTESRLRFAVEWQCWRNAIHSVSNTVSYTVFQTLYHTVYHTLCFKHCTIHCIIHCISNTVPYTVSYIVSNTASFNLFNNCVKHQPILTVFGMWHPEETLHDIG